MNDGIRREIESLDRVKIFGVENAAVIKNNARAVAGFQSLNTDLNLLDTTGGLRFSAIGTRASATVSKAAATAELRRQVRKIANTADTLEDNEPGFDNKFLVPRRNLSTATLLEVARAFAADAAPVKDLFEGLGMPADFITDLQDAINDVETSIGQQDSGQLNSVLSNAEIETILKRQLQNKRMLNTVILNLFADNPAKITEWETAYRVERPPKKQKNNPPTPPQP